MQHGPGAENAFGGVAQAYGDSVPILVMPGGYARRLTNTAPNFNSFLNFQHVTKWTEQVTLGAAVPDVMRRAFTQVRNGRPRPVLIEIPGDVFQEEIADDFVYAPAPVVRSAPDPAGVREVATVLRNAENPVIYAGQGVHYAKAWDELLELAELLQIPVTTSLQGKSAFPEDHPLSLGSGGRAVPKTVHQFLQDADVIFGIGCSFAATGFGIAMPPGKTIIHATLDPADLNKDQASQHQLVGDAKLTLQALLDELKGATPRTNGATAQIASMKQEWLSQWLPKLTAEETPISPYRVIWDLLQTVDVDNTIITHDAGSPRDQLSPFWESRTPMSYIGWGKTTQLGTGLGYAMGAKLARPGEALHQRLGRRRDRLHGDGLRDDRAGTHPHPLDPPQQLLDGDRAADHAGGDGEVPQHRHQRELRRHGESVRRLRRARQRPHRDRAGAQARASRRRRKAHPCCSSS